MLRQSQIAQPPARAANPPRRPRQRWKLARAALVCLVILGMAAGVLVYEDPSLVPQAVDTARAIFGPRLVAMVESAVFQAQDKVRQANYQVTGAESHLQWAATPAPSHPSSASPAQASATTTPADPTQPIRKPGQVASDISATAWAPFMYAGDGQPVLERALVVPDLTRPYVETALVRIDLRATNLHLVAGTAEPRSNVRAARPGVIPPADQRSGNLLAAFNGGFKAANGQFGMAVNGTTLLPPLDGIATLALYRDGSVRLGAWGSDIKPTPDMVAYRQNCPLLLADGQPTEAANSDDATLWGKTVGNRVATWRSGIGLSADGRYLIYAAGDGLTVPALAQALAAAGADRAMQLDINSWWARFVTYAPSGNRLVAQKLLTSMIGDARQFLVPDTRDFFYVTAR